MKKLATILAILALAACEPPATTGGSGGGSETDQGGKERDCTDRRDCGRVVE